MRAQSRGARAWRSFVRLDTGSRRGCWQSAGADLCEGLRSGQEQAGEVQKRMWQTCQAWSAMHDWLHACMCVSVHADLLAVERPAVGC